jgi:hypothetical protein
LRKQSKKGELRKQGEQREKREEREERGRERNKKKAAVFFSSPLSRRLRRCATRISFSWLRILYSREEAKILAAYSVVDSADLIIDEGVVIFGCFLYTMVRYHLLWQIVCLVSLLRIVQCLNTPSTKVISRKLPLRSNMQPIPSTELRSGVVLSSVPRIEADRKIILSVMLSASYLSVIVSVMTLPVALAAKDFFPSGGSFLSNVVSIGTIATVR